MPLSAPTIKSQVSVCSQHVLTEGNLTGAAVDIYQNGVTHIGQAMASSSQTWVPINPGVTLAQGDLITATQTLGTDFSGPSPQPKEVQGIPGTPPAPIFKTHLFGCAACLWLGGMVSGAKYRVTGQNQATLADEVRAEAVTGSGSSHVALNQPLWNGEKLKAEQDACGVVSGTANSQPAETYPLSKLPTPTVDTPLFECDSNIYGSDFVEGATAHMRREKMGALVQESASCSLGSVNFTASPHLDEGEEVWMWQDFKGYGGAGGDDKPDDNPYRRGCADRSDNSEKKVVLPVSQVEPPHIIEPLCANGKVVTLSNLRPGAKVVITHDGVDFIGQAVSTNAQDFYVDPLQGGKTVVARMEICGFKTGDSNTVDVNPQPANMPPPKVQDPLYSCTDVVRVRDIHPGALVLVYSTFVGEIGAAYVYDDEANITVTPALMDGDEIFAVQKGCGLVSDKSNVVQVQKPRELPRPVVVTPLYNCGEYVKVEKVVPGAIVEVYVNGNFAGGATVAEDEGSVKVNVMLVAKDQVKARQRLCDLISKFSTEVTVQEFIGAWEEKGWYDTNGNPISDSDKILAVHASLLRSGKILFFGGDQHTGSLNDSDDIDHTRLMDARTFRIQKITGLVSPPSDIFCAGHAQTADGDLLVAGGTYDWGLEGEHIDHAAANHFIGSRDSWTFDVASESWVRKGLLNHERPADFVSEHLARWQADNPSATAAQIMAKTNELTAQSDPSDPSALIHRTGGKWYPTVVTLPDGKLLCVSGHSREEDSRHNNNSLETYDPATGAWTLAGPKDADLVPRVVGRSYEYPRLVVLSDGTVFSSYNMQDGNVHKWTVGNDADAWTQVAGSIPGTPHSGLNGSATLLPFWLVPVAAGAYTPDKVLMTGGVKPQLIEPLSALPNWFDTAARQLQVSGTPPLRRNHNTVILPTGEIFVEGGVQVENDDDTRVLEAELYNPQANTWQTLPPANAVRNYHHVSLLLPNGSVYVGGSNVNAAPGLGARVFDIEVFKPWYFCRNRPVLGDVPNTLCHNSEVKVTSPDYERIAKVVIVRAGTTTHNFNCDQRMLELEMRKSEELGELTVRLPKVPNIAIVGYYLLFLLDRSNVPSEGKFIKVCKESSCFIATALYGYDSDEVRVLRNWRDEINYHVVGRAFIRAYETLSPGIARVLKRHATLQAPVRKVLNRLVSRLRANRKQ